MEIGGQSDIIIAELKELNARVKKQNSLWHMLLVGIVYGIGFIIGSAILATLTIGVFAPYFAQIPWVRTAYEQGNLLRK